MRIRWRPPFDAVPLKTSLRQTLREAEEGLEELRLARAERPEYSEYLPAADFKIDRTKIDAAPFRSGPAPVLELQQSARGGMVIEVGLSAKRPEDCRLAMPASIAATTVA